MSRTELRPGGSAWPRVDRRRRSARRLVSGRHVARARRRPATTDLAARAETVGLAPHDRARRCRATGGAGDDGAIGSLADPPKDAADAYLRLHLLSHRLIRPHQANLDGIFGLLANVAWTSAGPCPPERVDELRLERAARRAGRLTVYGVDKFPRMTDYVVPAGVRIADADRVRLGAHLATGTTVMHEGFVNFNAGTLGTSMVEGRISAGVVVGDGSDIGGGASIMGTLSGGGTEVDPHRRALPASAPTPASASRSATTAWSRPAATSPPARRSRCPTGGW